VTFKNRNGEGVVSTIESKSDKKSQEVLCGNSKLMKHFEILKPYPELEKNVGYLEEEGKTVVILAVDKIP
jgi:cation transport ATPase